MFKILIIYDMLHVTLLIRLPLFSHAYVEKIREPGDEAHMKACPYHAHLVGFQ